MYTGSASQLETYLTKYICKPFPAPGTAASYPSLRPEIDDDADKAVSQTVKLYDHAALHHFLEQAARGEYTLANTGSSFIESGNKWWKCALQYNTSLGGGHATANTDQTKQVFWHVILVCNYEIAQHHIDPDAYMCRVCGEPKRDHECLLQLQHRAAALQERTAVSWSPSQEPLLPIHGATIRVPLVALGSHECSHVRLCFSSLEHISCCRPNSVTTSPPPTRFLCSPNTVVMIDRLWAAVGLFNTQYPGAFHMGVPTQDEMLQVARHVSRGGFLEETLIDGGGCQILMNILNMRAFTDKPRLAGQQQHWEQQQADEVQQA